MTLDCWGDMDSGSRRFAADGVVRSVSVEVQFLRMIAYSFGRSSAASQWQMTCLQGCDACGISMLDTENGPSLSVISVASVTYGKNHACWHDRGNLGRWGQTHA